MKRILLFLTLLFLIGVKTFGQVISNNNLGIDHIFIWCDDHIKMEEIFNKKGFVTHSGVEHKGQGTIGSYIFFSNLYIELISVSNEEEFKINNNKYNLKSFSLKPNWKNNNSSPFGIGLNLIDSTNLYLGFNTFKYRQDWMKDSTYILMASSIYTHDKEPGVFIVPEYMKYNPIKMGDLLNHTNKIKTVTSITILSKNKNNWSKTVKTLNKFDKLKIKSGDLELMTIIFDNNVAKETIDFRPELPLIIKY